jgi:hypothetical protein
MPQGNMFSRSNRAQMMSSHLVDQNQGGGDKKAGLVPRVAKDHWFAIYTNYNTKPMSFMRVDRGPQANQSRPIQGRPDNYIGQGGRY